MVSIIGPRRPEQMGRRLLAALLVVVASIWMSPHITAAAQDSILADGPPPVVASDQGAYDERRLQSPRGEQVFEDLDKDHDGRVTRKEFNFGSHTGASDVAFGCLDADMNGYVTKEEQGKLKKAFFRSHLSQLNEEGIRDWLSYRKCVPTDFSKYVARFTDLGVNGLSLWEYAVKRPGLLKEELNIDSVNARRTLVQAVCREIEGLGCLGPPSEQAVVLRQNEPAVGAVADGNTTPHSRAFFLSKVHADAQTFFEGGQDSNDDGQVSEAEFVRQQSIRGAGIRQAYSCLDADSNGQITRQEMWEMKNQFWRSKLSKLSTSELVNWISNPKCVDADMSEHLPAFHAKQVAGLSMWTYGIQNPIMMKTQLGIQSDMKRAHISESV